MNSSTATATGKTAPKIATPPGVILHSSASHSASSAKYKNRHLLKQTQPQQQHQEQKTFSEDDVDLLVRLVLSGEWHHVHFYFNFLISHYQKYLVVNGSLHSEDTTTVPRTSSIINNLYELLVNIKVQQYFEALESGDMRTVSELICHDLPTLQLYIHPHLYQQIQLFAHDRQAFYEYKEQVLKLNDHSSCRVFRNLVANDVRDGLTSLVHMYNNYNSNKFNPNDTQSVIADETTSSEEDRCSVSSRSNSPSELAIADDSLDYLERGVSSGHNLNHNKRKYSVMEEPSVMEQVDHDSTSNHYSYEEKENTARPLLSSWKRARRPPSHKLESKEQMKDQYETNRDGENGMDALLKAFHIVNSPESSPPPQATHPVIPAPPPNQPSPTITASQPSYHHSQTDDKLLSTPYTTTANPSSTIHPTVSHRKKRHNSPKASGSVRKAKVDPNLEKKITDSLDFKAIKNQKSIKPTVKLCTGGITSTPALRERMFKVLEQFDTPCTWDCIQSKVSGNRAKVWATLCMLVNAGVVIQSGKGRRGHPYKYILSPDLTSDKLTQLEINFKNLDSEAQKIHKQYKQEMQRQQLQEQMRKTQELSQQIPLITSSASSQTKTTQTNIIPSTSSVSPPASSTSAFSRGAESREPRLLSGRVDV